MENLPKDPVMLLSIVNMKLRDFYPSLEAMCDDMDLDAGELKARLAAIGYTYNPEANAFR